LEGHPSHTWENDDKCCWPKDLLPTKIEGARILSFGYASLLSPALAENLKKLDASQDHYPLTFGAFGRLLYSHLVYVREALGFPNSPPIIFVAHSLGGMVVRSVSCK
jgi:hypothetical protein